jgi:hypothetical protein
MFLYALAKQCYNVFFPIHRPYCRVCGRVREQYHVGGATWHQVTGGLDSLCFRHFDQLARTRGVQGTWQLALDEVWPPSDTCDS